jgi:hypothetical protein
MPLFDKTLVLFRSILFLYSHSYVFLNSNTHRLHESVLVGSSVCTVLSAILAPNLDVFIGKEMPIYESLRNFMYF